MQHLRDGRLDLAQREWRPHRPEILSSTEEARAIVLDLPAGEALQDHQVHEGARIFVVRGEMSITNDAGDAVDGRRERSFTWRRRSATR